MRIGCFLVFFLTSTIITAAIVVKSPRGGEKSRDRLIDVERFTVGKQEISVVLSGGLGNQLFQLAALFSVALDNDHKFKVILPDVVKVPFNRTTYWNSSLQKLKPLLSKKLLTTADDHKDNSSCVVEQNPGLTWSLSNSSCINATAFTKTWSSSLVSTRTSTCQELSLHGYFQHPRFFMHHLPLIRNLLWDDDIALTASQRLKSLIGWHHTRSPPVVSLHYRLGDYDSLGWVLDQDYYQAALDVVNKRLHGNYTCIIFSDEPQRAWQRSASLDGCANRVLVPKNESDVMSFYMMSLVPVNILADSSFSYWSGLLSRDKQLVVAPSMGNGSSGCWSYFSQEALREADPDRDWASIPARSISSQALFTEELMQMSDPDE